MVLERTFLFGFVSDPGVSRTHMGACIENLSQMGILKRRMRKLARALLIDFFNRGASRRWGQLRAEMEKEILLESIKKGEPEDRLSGSFSEFVVLNIEYSGSTLQLSADNQASA